MDSALIKRVQSEIQEILLSNSVVEGFNKAKALLTTAIKEEEAKREATTSLNDRSVSENDICSLYILLATLEDNHKQKKAAKLLFEEAISKEYCKKEPKIWIAYLNFYIKEDKKSAARKYFKIALESVDKDNDNELWKMYVEFERRNGRPDLTIPELKREVFNLPMDPVKPSGSSMKGFDMILKKSNNIDMNLILEHDGFKIDRSKRPMALFSEPQIELRSLTGREESPDIPNRILYYLGVVLTDPQVFEIVESLRQIQVDKTEELDISQRLCYEHAYSKVSILDIPPGEAQARILEEMKPQYESEREVLANMIKDFQSRLQDCGLPGFCVTDDRNQLNIQRKMLQIIQLIQQDMKRKSSIPASSYCV